MGEYLKKIFLFAGEPSGDMHGSRLVSELKQIYSDAQFLGVAGPLMRKEGVSGPLMMEDFQVMGFTDVFCSLPSLVRQFYLLRRFLLENTPDYVILIDYPGFNLRLARSLRKKGYKGKIVQFISPSVWAHGRKRINTLEDYFDLLLTIYPFENQFFSDSKLRVKYVGNPLMDQFSEAVPSVEWRQSLAIPHSKKIITLFPGSRKSEIILHTSLMLEAASRLKVQDPTIIFCISVAQEQFEEQIKVLVERSSLKRGEDIFIVSKGYREEILRDSHAALAKSGTVTLELAIRQVPSVVIYRVSKVNYWVAKGILRLKLKFFCIVNIIAGKEVFPEFVGYDLSVEKIAHSLLEASQMSLKRQQIIEGCQEVRGILGRRSAHAEAAKCIVEL